MKKGLFKKGHKVLVNNKRDKVTGQFTKTKTLEEKRLRHNKMGRDWNKLHPEYKINYWSKNKEKFNLINRNNSYLRKYGITLEQKKDLLKQQNYQCLICNKIISISAAVDHNHETGEIRGILCFACNVALGGFQDNIELLQRAIKYLRKEVA